MAFQDRHDPATFTLTRTSTELLEGLRTPANNRAWQEFVDRYRPVIIRYGLKLGLDREDAEDAAQQALMAFATGYVQGKYDHEKGRLRAWLFGIASNKIKSALSNRKRRGRQVCDASHETGFFERIADADQWEPLWDQEWDQAVLRQCLAEVRRVADARTVECFELFAWKGWPARDVAQHLGMTENSVYLAKRRVLRQIQELLPQVEEIW